MSAVLSCDCKADIPSCDHYDNKHFIVKKRSRLNLSLKVPIKGQHNHIKFASTSKCTKILL